MSNLPTGTVTLLFTDMEGSTLLLQQLGDRYASVLADCRQLIRSAFARWNGHEVDTQGDSFCVVFARANDAILAALDIQRALRHHSWTEGVTVRVRIGIHTGEPQLSHDGYIGVDVHHAARIMSATHGGQVLLSQTTRELVEQSLQEGVYLRDLGEHRLKDLGRPSHLFQLSSVDLPADFPPQTLLTRLQQGLSVLAGGAHDLPARQQTLRGAIAWSYDLLSPGEQRLFRRLAIFVDGCTWEAAYFPCAIHFD